VKQRALALLLTVATVVLVICSWQVYVTVSGVSSFVLPRPAEVATATGSLLSEQRMWVNLWVTLREIVFGFAAAVLLGIVTGLLLGSFRLLEQAFRPLLVALQVVPKVAVIPLLLLWFGFGMTSKVVIAALFAYFPIAVATIAGVRAVDPSQHDLMTLLGASRRQRLVVLVLPAALPLVLTGMEVGIVLAAVGAVVAEYLAGGEGLGWMAVTSLNQLRVDTLFGVFLILSTMGFLLYVCVVALRRLLVPWHASVARER
jgi:NitT/TauT family transport system permease protein